MVPSMALNRSSLIAELPCGVTVAIPGDAHTDSVAEHASLMSLVDTHRSGCVRCRVFQSGAGGVAISRRR
jgi:hypothetical protein